MSQNSEINSKEVTEVKAVTRAQTKADQQESDSDLESDSDEPPTPSRSNPILDKDQIRTYQQEDPRLKYIYNYLANGTLPGTGDPKLARNTLTMAPDFSLVDGLLYRLSVQKQTSAPRPLLCTLFRLNWAKQTPGIMRRN